MFETVSNMFKLEPFETFAVYNTLRRYSTLFDALRLFGEKSFSARRLPTGPTVSSGGGRGVRKKKF